MSVITETMIANRALQRCGALRIADGALRTEDSKNANEIEACYDMLRRAEMRRNVWRFSIRTTALRAIGDFSKFVTFGAYSSGTSYAVNDVALASDGQVYSSRVAANTGHDPTTSQTYWTLYFGNLIAQEYVTTWSATPTYAIDDHAVGSDSQVYRSLQNANVNHNPVGDGDVHWSLATTVDEDDLTEEDDQAYYAGEVVYKGNKVYISLVNDNETDPGSSSWLLFTTAPTLSKLNFIYPIGAGPSSNTTTRNAYRVPNGFLREAPQDPKAGAATFLGAPTGLFYTDWNFEGDYFTTRDTGVIPFRFAADINDPAAFDPLFAEGFACRIALEVCEPITQSNSKIQTIAGEYKKFMTEARTVNGIETGAVQPPEDDYIATRY